MSDAIVRRVENALARAHRINWMQADRDVREGSQIALMREFLRRMALWAHALRSEDNWPFFSVADRVAQSSPAVRARLVASVPESVDVALADLPFYQQRICSWHVRWCAIEDLDEVRALALAAPYEPALLLFERGGVFRVENRTFQFNLAGFHFGTVASLLVAPVVTVLDAESLARWDATWRQELEEIGRKD